MHVTVFCDGGLNVLHQSNFFFLFLKGEAFILKFSRANRNPHFGCRVRPDGESESTCGNDESIEWGESSRGEARRLGG